MPANRANRITVFLPNGTRRDVSVSDIGEDLEGLAASSAELGMRLVLRVSVDHEPEIISAGADDIGAEAHTREVRAVRPAAKRSRSTGQRWNIDKIKLRAAMRRKNFSTSAYSREIGVPVGTVQYHVGKMKA